MKLYVSASAEQWQKIAYEIIAKAGEAAGSDTMQVELPAKIVSAEGREIEGIVQFDNDDMEGRPDLAPDAVFGGFE